MSATPGVQRTSIRRGAIRVIKLGISIVWFTGSWLWDRICLILGRAQSRICVVLYYHSVPSAYRDRYAKQMKMISAHCKPISLDDLESPFRTHSVAVTFDDGLESFASHAVPILEQLQIPATVFAVSDAFGERPRWGESYYGSEERVMSEEQLRSLPSMISVGSHTLTHANLKEQDRSSSQQEIAESRRKLETLLGRPVTTFSFPHGEFTSETIEQSRAAGYERVFTVEPRPIRSGQVGFVVGRVAADPWDWPLEFKLKILGAYCWQSYLLALRQKAKKLLRKDDRAPAEFVRANPAVEAQAANAPHNT